MAPLVPFSFVVICNWF